MNNKVSSKKMATLASEVLRSDKSSTIQKSLAASVVSQRSTNKMTGEYMETKASQVLKSPKYSNVTKKLAASVLVQSNK